ncbi:MAG: SDR family NAD(P)-dependent oxidoreductase [Spirochaetota bacterium]
MFSITGATGGLGKAFAAECASRGWDLFLTDLRAENLAMLAKGLERSHSVSVLYHAANLTDAVSRAEMFDKIRSEGWRFRGLLNVAGLDHEGLFYERSREEISAIIRLNVEATLIVTRALLDFKDAVIPFRIINVSSLAAFFSMPVKATYAASKRFLLDFSLALRNELREQNVTVTVLCPAGLPTNAECITAIEAQGILGQLTTEDIGKVAHQTIEAALLGRAIVIPGFLNQALKWLGGLVPPASLAELVGNRWRMAHQKSVQRSRLVTHAVDSLKVP